MIKILFFCFMALFLQSIMVFSMEDEEDSQTKEWTVICQKALNFMDREYENIKQEMKQKQQQELQNQIDNLNKKLEEPNISNDDKQEVLLEINYVEKKKKPITLNLNESKTWQQLKQRKKQKMTENFSNRNQENAQEVEKKTTAQD